MSTPMLDAIVKAKIAGHKTDDGYIFYTNEAAAERALRALAESPEVRAAWAVLVAEALENECLDPGMPDFHVWATDMGRCAVAAIVAAIQAELSQ